MNLPVYANSLKVDSFPVIFDKNCRVPKSAAIPISIYFIVNSASAVQYRTSHIEIRSTPPPIHFPWIPTKTGTRQSKTFRNVFCMSMIA